jgi:hypothetical protein
MQVPKYLYHATYKAVLHRIREKGLDTNDVIQAYPDSVPGHVYLAKDPWAAISYAKCSDDVPESWLYDIVLLEVDTTDLDPEKFFPDPNIQGNRGDSFVYEGEIPWEFMEQVDD